MIKSKTLTINVGFPVGFPPKITEVVIGVSYLVLWTGEDYEVTVFDSEPPDNETPEYLERFNVESLHYVGPRVDQVLIRVMKEQISQYANIVED